MLDGRGSLATMGDLELVAATWHLLFHGSIQMLPPYEFSNRSERWVCSECASAVVSCEFRPDPSLVKKRWDSIVEIPKEDKDANLKRIKDSKGSVYCTGFFMGEDTLAYYVLTCAHVLGPAFDAQHPLTAQEAQVLYQPYILCDHREQRYRDGEDQDRVPLRVSIAGISCFRDLLLLRVPKFRLWTYCGHDHRLLRFAEMIPAPCKKVLMVSWPLHLNLTRTEGTVSHQARSHHELARENPCNFAMSLSEVNMNSEPGSSGAPVMYGLDVAGMLHGGHNGTSYFISLADIRTCLTEEFGFIIR